MLILGFSLTRELQYPYMNSPSRITRFLHASLARSSLGLKTAVALRSFGREVIAKHVLPSHDPAQNGEFAFAERIAPQCSTFIEVGAKAGVWAEFFLEKSGVAGPNGLLFEPCEVSCEQLNALYRDSLQVEVIQAAVGHALGEAYFFEKPGGRSSLSLFDLFEDSDSAQKRYRVTTLDEETYQRGWDYVDFVKINAEGSDGLVLLGANRLISEKRIGMVQFEYGERWAKANKTLCAAIDFLKIRGYETYILHKDGLYLFDYKYLGDFFCRSHFVALLPHKEVLLGDFLRKHTCYS